MTPIELMEAMGTIRDKYVLEAHNSEAEPRKRRPTRRVLLVAAVISLMILLLGCAAVLLGLGELKLAREPVGPHGEFSSDVISLQGYAGTPNYQAAKEWEDFLQSYDQDGKLLAEAAQGSCSFDPAGISMEYAAYTCYTEEMMTKIDEICEKYGLEILGPIYFAEDDPSEGFRETLHELGIDSLFWGSGEAELSLDSLYYFREGSFQLDGYIQLKAPGNPWPYATGFQYRSVMKTTFDSVFLTVGDIEDYTQWNYTLQDGTQVLLAQSYDQSLIIVDRDTHFVTVNIPMILIGKTDNVIMDRKALEAIADAFTFDYTPHRPDPDTLVLSDRYLPVMEDVPEATQECMPDPAEEEIQRIITSFREAYPEKTLKYALYDFDLDGDDDLAIWYDGAYRALYLFGEEFDSPREFQLDSGFQVYETYLQMELNVRYQGEILGTVETVDGVEYHNYYHLSAFGNMHWWDTVKQEGNQYYRGIPGSWDIPYDTPVETWEPITQEEYAEILDSYLPQPVELRGVASSEEKAAVQQSFTAILEGSGTFYEDRVDSREKITLTRYCETFTEDFAATLTELTVVDFERDGIPEAVFQIALGENTDCGVLVLHWEDGEVWGHTFSNRQMQGIKTDGTYYWSGSASNHGVARISFSKGEYTRQDILWVDEINGTLKYYLDGTEISHEAFKHHSTLYSSKEDPQWRSYPGGEYSSLFDLF